MKNNLKIFGVLLLSVLILTGCGSSDEKEVNKAEVAMEEQARLYYQEYQSGIPNMTEVIVEVGSLKNANEKFDAGYVLTDLETCTDTSKVIFTVNEDNTEITEVKFEMECE